MEGAQGLGVEVARGCQQSWLDADTPVATEGPWDTCLATGLEWDGGIPWDEN